MMHKTEKGLRAVHCEPLLSAPADHGEGGRGEVQFRPGEAGDTTEWYGAQVHLKHEM